LSLDSDTGERSYGCSNGDGNPYDFVVITVVDATTQFLCTPCFVQAAIVLVSAVTEPDDPEIQAAVAAAGTIEQVPMHGRKVAARGHEAPTEVDSESLIAAYDSRILPDELPDEFK
jgi:hypothetical protein